MIAVPDPKMSETKPVTFGIKLSSTRWSALFLQEKFLARRLLLSPGALGKSLAMKPAVVYTNGIVRFLVI